MANIQIFDPAQPQRAGLSADQVAQLAADFDADIEWLRGDGATIERFHQQEQADAFSSNPTVKALLDREGEEALPIILVDGELALSGRYPNRTELSGWAHTNKLVILQGGSSDCCSGGQCG